MSLRIKKLRPRMVLPPVAAAGNDFSRTDLEPAVKPLQ